MNEIFGRSGTMQSALDVSNSIQSMQSSNSMDRLGGLAKMVQIVMSLFA